MSNASNDLPASDFATRLKSVQARIDAAWNNAPAASASRPQLLAVSKTFPASDVIELAACGQRAFGENYVQEGVDKIQTVRQAGLTDLQWHFIGPLQSNKSRAVAEHFDWVHTVDRQRIAQRLSEQRPGNLPPLNVCLQVKTSAEDSKHGAAPAEIAALAQFVSQQPHLRLRGLMTLPEPGHEAFEFETLRKLFIQLHADYPQMDTLSMGMSADLETAIAHGSNCVRVGTALFGARTKPTTSAAPETSETPGTST